MYRGTPRGQCTPKGSSIGVTEKGKVGVFLSSVTVVTHRVVGDSNGMHEFVGGKSVMVEEPEKYFQLIKYMKFLNPVEAA